MEVGVYTSAHFTDLRQDTLKVKSYGSTVGVFQYKWRPLTPYVNGTGPSN